MARGRTRRPWLAWLLVSGPASSVAASSASQFGGHGHTGSVVLGREDLLRVRASLGRISDEMHLILGVLDQHLDPALAGPSAGPHAVGRELGEDFDASAAEGAEHEEFVPLPREEFQVATPAPEARARVLAAWAWAAAEWFFWGGVCVLDIAIIIGMQLFLESISRKRGGSSIISKRSAANAIASKAGGPPGAPIPAPSGTPRSSSQRLSVLSQEELLAACLTEHWGKLAIGVGLMVACRLPQQLLNSNGFFCQMMVNLTVMLRCMSLVMLLIREDMALPRPRSDQPASRSGSG